MITASTWLNFNHCFLIVDLSIIRCILIIDFLSFNRSVIKKNKVNDMSKLVKKQEIRYKENPFLNEMNVVTKRKNVRLAQLGKDDDILINQETGEARGTHVATYKMVDNETFIKLFTQNIGLIFDLTPAGVKALNLLIWAVQYKAINKDIVCLNTYTYEDFLEDFPDKKKGFSYPSFMRGLAQLEEAKIVAKCQRKGDYFINPNFIFNGDRVAFTKIIERKKQDEQVDIKEAIEDKKSKDLSDEN